MEDTLVDITCTGGASNDDILVDEYVLDDDEYNYSVDINSNSVPSNGKI